jgi:hypothetical protein
MRAHLPSLRDTTLSGSDRSVAGVHICCTSATPAYRQGLDDVLLE